MSRLLSILLTAVLSLFGLSECAPAGQDHEDPGGHATEWQGPEHSSGTFSTGERVAFWSQDHGPDPSALPDSEDFPLLLATAPERDDWINRAPEEFDMQAVAEVDLDEHVVVVGGYYRCMEHGSVWATGAGHIWFEVVEPAGEEITDCEWSPYTVEVYAVPRAEVGAHPELTAPPAD